MITEIADLYCATPAVERPGILAVLGRSRVQTLLALTVYVILALAVTWPWALHPRSTVYGVVGSDLTSSVAIYQQYANDGQPPFLPGNLHGLNAPEGFAPNWAVHVASFGSSTILWLLSVVFGAVAAHGIVAVTGFAFTAFAMFLLVRHITGNAAVAFPIGLAFGFWPYQYGTGWTWPHYIHLWVLVLLFWRMLVVVERPTVRNGLLSGAAAVLAMTWIEYYLLIGGVTYVTLALAALVRALHRSALRAQLAAQAAGAALVILALGMVALAGNLAHFAGIPNRTATDISANAARPLMYVVPSPRSPLFHSLTRHWIYSRYAGPTGHPPTPASYAEIYLGIPLLALAIIGGLWMVTRGRRHPPFPGALGTIGTAFVLGVVAFAWGAPPKVSVFGVLVPMPNAALTHFTYIFRASHRFAVVLMLAVCLLATVPLVVLLAKRRPRVQVVACCALAVIFAVDLRAQPHPVTTRLHERPLYAALARQAPGIVAEYPVPPPDVAQNQYSLRSSTDAHPLFQGAAANTPSGSAKDELQFLSADLTLGDLAGYGVRYVIVDTGADRIAHPEDLRLLASDGRGSLYRLVARPNRFTSYAVQGFNQTEGTPPGLRWQSANNATIELLGRCRPCSGIVSFGTGVFARPRTLTISGPDGVVLFSKLIASSAASVRFPVEFSSRAVLHLSTDPAPERVNAFLGGADTRLFGVFVTDVRFTARSGTRWTNSTTILRP